MKQRPHFLIVALVALVLSGLSFVSGQTASAVTLESIADRIRVPDALYGPGSFAESSALLEATIRQALAHGDNPATYALRKDITLKATAAPDGVRAFSATDCTLRELLRRFAITWNVSARLNGNQILLEPGTTLKSR